MCGLKGDEGISHELGSMDRPRPFGVRIHRCRVSEGVRLREVQRTEKYGPTGITRGLAAFIGIAELAGGVGIILPRAANMAPWLSLWAAIGLSAIMLLAIGFHLLRRESSVRPAVLFLVAMFVVYGRLTLLKQ